MLITEVGLIILPAGLWPESLSSKAKSGPEARGSKMATAVGE